MSKHLADRREPSDGGRLKHFLTIARDGGSSVWARLHRRAQARAEGGRKILEYARIERGRDT